MNETKIINVVWAVEFGGSAVRRFRLTRTDGGYCADRYAETSLPARWTAAPDIIAAAGRLPVEEISDPLVACLGNDLVLYRTIQLPQADDAMLEKMIQSQLETLLPTQVEKFATAWKTRTDPGTSDLQHVLLCAVRRESLTTVSGVCARWRKGGADVTPALPALANAWAELSDTPEPVLLMDVGARSTAIATVLGRRMWRCAVVDAGGDTWTERIAKSLGVSCDEAERRKLQLAEKDDAVPAKVLDEALSAWAGGLREAYDDCLTETPRDARPTRCVIFGRSARLTGVASRVSAALGIDADVAQTPDTLCLEEGMAFDSLGPLVGAAIGAMRDPASMIRLARGKKDKPDGRKKKRWHWAAAIVWLVASVATLYALDLHEASRREEMVDTVYRETYRQGGLTRQLAMGGFLENGTPVPLDVLERITRVAPKSIIVTSLTYARNGQVSLQGTVANDKECQDFLKKLVELGQVEPRRTWPDKNRCRFEIDLIFTRPFSVSGKPATQPATAPAPQPGKTPETKPSTAPADSPTTRTASQPASQPTGGAK